MEYYLIKFYCKYFEELVLLIKLFLYPNDINN